MGYVGTWTIPDNEVEANDALHESGEHPESIRNLNRPGWFKGGKFVADKRTPTPPNQLVWIVRADGHVVRVPFVTTQSLVAKGGRLATQADIDAHPPRPHTHDLWSVPGPITPGVVHPRTISRIAVSVPREGLEAKGWIYIGPDE